MIELTQTRSIPDVLERLQAAPRDRRYLSVHLDTSPGQTIGQAYATWLRDAARRVRLEHEEMSRAEAGRLEHAIAAAERLVASQASPEPAGLAFYADGTGELELAVPLPLSPVNVLAWRDAPIIEPLLDVLDEQERVAVVLVDKERTRLFTVFLGEIEERTAFVDEVAGKQATGEWFGLSQKRFERHHDLEVARHVKRTIRALVDELRERPFDRLLVGGSPEALTTLMHQLPRPLRDRLAGTVRLELFATEAEILAETLREGLAAERRQELDAVRALLEASTGQNAAVGVDATLAVLNEARVHRLFIARGLALTGGACESCQRLVTAAETCPVCGGPVTADAYLRERALTAALAQGARVEIVDGEAADLLRRYGGMAAWTRY